MVTKNVGIGEGVISKGKERTKVVPDADRIGSGILTDGRYKLAPETIAGAGGTQGTSGKSEGIKKGNRVNNTSATQNPTEVPKEPAVKPHDGDKAGSNGTKYGVAYLVNEFGVGPGQVDAVNTVTGNPRGDIGYMTVTRIEPSVLQVSTKDMVPKEGVKPQEKPRQYKNNDGVGRTGNGCW